MKRLHVHARVSDLPQSIAFYTKFFDHDPTVVRDDYAKWLLDDPMINFAISPATTTPGIDHIGIQLDTQTELDALSKHFQNTGVATQAQEATECCYAVSNKHWVADPSGIKWETFHSFGTSDVYGDDVELNPIVKNSPARCC